MKQGGLGYRNFSALININHSLPDGAPKAPLSVSCKMVAIVKLPDGK